MSCSISDARRLADFRSANPVEITNRCPLIIFLKYQVSPRFIKAMTHPLCHPAIESESIEQDDSPVLHERNLATPDAVVQRIDAHAEVPRGRVDIQPARFNEGIVRPFAWFHDGTPDARAILCGEVLRRGPGHVHYLAEIR